MKLFRRIREWRDRRFLKRVERVLNENILKANIAITGEFAYGVPSDYDLGSLFCKKRKIEFTESDLEKFRKAQDDFQAVMREESLRQMKCQTEK